MRNSYAILSKLFIAILFNGWFPIAFGQALIPENFYIHLNQPLYVVGETIWFKVYQTNFHEHDDHSKILYVNLHDKNGMLLLQQKLQLTDGLAHGSLDIPLTFQENHYYLTYFTKWNLQFGENSINCIEIPVFNPYNDLNLPRSINPFRT